MLQASATSDCLEQDRCHECGRRGRQSRLTTFHYSCVVTRGGHLMLTFHSSTGSKTEEQKSVSSNKPLCCNDWPRCFVLSQQIDHITKVHTANKQTGQSLLHLEAMMLEVGLCPGHAHSTSRLQDGASLVEDIPDGRTGGCIVHQHHPIHHLPAQPEGLGPHLFTAAGFRKS